MSENNFNNENNNMNNNSPYYDSDNLENLKSQPQKSGFNKNVYLVVITVITIVCVIAGALVHIVGNYSFRGNHNRNYGQVITETKELSDIQRVKVDADMMSVEFERGSEFKLEITSNENIMPEIEEENGVLTLTQHPNGINFNVGMNDTNVKCECIITVPEDVTLTNINMELDLGNIEINDLSVGDITVEADLGNVEIKNVTMSGDVTIEADLGNVELRNCAFAGTEIEADMGNIELHSCTFTKANCNADMGNVSISGDFDRVTASCSMGSVQIDSDDLTDDILDLETDMGAVIVNGTARGTEYHQ